ncbi:carbohydrate kinase, thermoresistant glucokinase family [Gloeobacter kilaueensis JS1]|uniref:Gluconokinase n=2 Tax=Gloeobacter TaxID=33071 RepID=U5QL91_GLOK1|nr:carbohydrate kinase, thermoresistant glucokinase family [Gloeobacter kilaueensis JS1]
MGWQFADADDFHSAQAIAKMHAHFPLSDADRLPWLARLHQAIRTWQGQKRDVVLACSALKERYRQVLKAGDPAVQFVFLQISFALASQRVAKRAAAGGHFMPPDLLQSQFDDLEVPTEAIVVDMDKHEPLDVQIEQVRRQLGL